MRSNQTTPNTTPNTQSRDPASSIHIPETQIRTRGKLNVGYMNADRFNPATEALLDIGMPLCRCPMDSRTQAMRTRGPQMGNNKPPSLQKSHTTQRENKIGRLPKQETLKRHQRHDKQIQHGRMHQNSIHKRRGDIFPRQSPNRGLDRGLDKHTRAGGLVVLGDFTAHHPAWGAATTTPRGQNVFEWAETHDFTLHIHYLALTWRRGDKESLLDLVLAPTLTPLRGLNLARIGCNHDLIAGTIAPKAPRSHTYRPPDWKKWDMYIEEETQFEPVHFNDAYKSF